LCGFGSLSPARTFVEPPPAPSRYPVVCNSEDCAAKQFNGQTLTN